MNTARPIVAVAAVVALACLWAARPRTGHAEDAPLRTWTDSTGQHKTEASLVEFRDGRVTLKLRDGRQVQLVLERLSARDQRFVREQTRPSPPPRSTEPNRRTTPAGDTSADWAVWRGPHFNGVAADGPPPPVSWSSSENVVWKAPVPGRGHSSPTVVGNRVYLTTADQRRQTQSVLAYDRADGRPVWQTEVSRGGFPEEIHNKNTHASPTIASDGDRLFVCFFHDGEIELSALTLEGQIAWQRSAGPFAPRQYRYGYAPSPTIFGGLVIVAADYDGGGRLAAFDRRSGQPRWQTPRPAKISYSSPIVTRLAGRDQLLISGCDMVASYDPQDGRPLWSAPGTSMATCGTIVWDGDLIFASGGYPNPETICVRGDGSGQVVWKNNQKCYEQSMLAADGYVYAVNDRGIAYCWRAADGTEMWQSRLAGGAVSSSPILANGNIYATNERGTTYVFRASPESFQLVAQNQLGDEAFATPAICGGRIYHRVADNTAGREEMLYCLGSDG